MNRLFFWMIVLSFGLGAWHQYQGAFLNDIAPLTYLSQVLLDSTTQAITLSIGILGTTCFFLGLLKIAEQGGLLDRVAHLLTPLLCRLFPEVPAQHPAMGAIVMNLSANALGLGNAATPFGLKAMHHLESLNPQPGTASNAMVLFVAMNTASITLLPANVIALRAAAGSQDPTGILPTTLFATVCATLIAVLSTKMVQGFFPVSSTDSAQPPPPPKHRWWQAALPLVVLGALLPLMIVYGVQLSPWMLPLFIVGILLYGAYQKVAVYDAFIQGAQEGFTLVLKIVPYLIGMLCAIGLFKASGILSLLVHYCGFITTPLGFPAEALPMALLRPFSSSGAYALVTEIFQDPAFGPDSLLGYLVSTIQSSTETTFYVLAVYYGSVHIKRIRHTLIPALLTDFTSIGASAFIVYWLFA